MAYDPFFSTNPVVDALEAHRGRVEQTRENTARLAQAFATYNTTGDGEFLLEEPYRFGCTFTERPIVSYGYAIDTSTQTSMEEEVILGRMPRAIGGVRKWIKDDRDFYIGAYVFFTVDTSAVATTTVPEGEEPPPPPPDEPATGTQATFTDNFDRPNSQLIGRGWQQTGGDFFIDTNRAITKDASSFMAQGFGRKNMVLTADLRSPNDTQPCIYVWSNSTAGGLLGYCLSFSPTATGHNLVLRRSNEIIHAKHFGATGVVIGNVFKKLKLEVIEDIPQDVVRVRAFVDDREEFTFSEPIEHAPTGGWSGVGNYGGATPSTGGVVVDNVIMAEVAAPGAEPLPPPPTEAEPATVAPAYVIEHDFTFTGIALKDLPEHLLDPGTTVS